MVDCVFCEIVAGQAEASVVCEDDATLTFMDIKQFPFAVIPSKAGSRSEEVVP